MPQSLFFISFCLTFLTFPLLSQEVIFFKNPSFEGVPGYGRLANGWSNCSFNNETPPDLHPIKSDYLKTNQTPKHGNTFVGMVGRDYGRSESIGQELDRPLEAGKCYEFSLWLSKSDSLFAIHRLTRQRTNFDQPLLLAVWGGNSPCGKKEILAISPLVDHTDWIKYRFQIYPEENLTHLSFEAYYDDAVENAYNGNILLDHASPIIPMDCETKEYLIDPSSIKEPTFLYIEYLVPENRDWAALYAKKTMEGRYFRIARNEEELKIMIEKKCGKIGFKKGGEKLLEEGSEDLMEIALNINSFKDHFLTVYIFAENNKLFKKRKRAMERLFAAINVLPKKFTVVKKTIINNYTCGTNEVWLEVKKQ